MGKPDVDLTPEQRAIIAERERLLRSPRKQAQAESLRQLGKKLGLTQFAEDLKKLREAGTPTPQEPTPPEQKPRKQGGGRKPKLDAKQQKLLQKQYSRDLKKDPLLAKHDAAVPHVQKLAKTKYKIDVGRNTLLDQIIRPVLRV